MALVLAVGGVRELLAEGVRGVVERSGELPVLGQVERFAEEPVGGGVDGEGDRVVVGERLGRDADDLPDRLGEQLLVARLPVDELRDSAVEGGVEAGAERAVARAVAARPWSTR